MKHFLLFILFICAGDSFSQDANVDRIPISYYILTRPLILEGEIIDYRDKMITVSIKSILKGTLRSKKLKIRINYPLSKELNGLGLETNQSYIFILGKRHNAGKHVIYQTSHRLKTKNDSLFIPDLNLRGMNKDSAFNIWQHNTFDDPIYQTGYKISVADFNETVKQINETFQFVGKRRNRSRRVIRCYWKKKEIDTTTTPFNIALLNEINRIWERDKCE